MRKLFGVLILTLLLCSYSHAQELAFGVGMMNQGITVSAAAGCEINYTFTTAANPDLNFYSVRDNAATCITTSGGKGTDYNTGHDNTCAYTTAVSTDDHCAQADITKPAGDVVALYFRMSSASSTSATHYGVAVETNYVTVKKGSGHGWGSNVSASKVVGWADGETHNLRACGVLNGGNVDIYVYLDGTVVTDLNPITDSTSPYTTGKYVGIGYSANGTNSYFDNLKANPTASGCMP